MRTVPVPGRLPRLPRRLGRGVHRLGREVRRLGRGVRRLNRRFRGSTDPPDPGYAEAYRLLARLRSVTRTLPGPLDPVTQAQTLLDGLYDALGYDRGGIWVRSRSGQLVVLTLRGLPEASWDLSLRGPSAAGEAWASQDVTLRDGGVPHRQAGGRASGQNMLVPLRVGSRTVGLVALESDRPGTWGDAEVAAAAKRVEPFALPLETALLFREIRDQATTEERHRLAREIHDGIAQELATLGYALDDVLAGLPDLPATEDLRTVRQTVARMVTELRLSLFDLRSDVDPHGGLAAAVAEYVREVGATSGLTVHLSLDEGPSRLPPHAESELLRIVQEAVTNARKHAAARNLWVSCRIDPPEAVLSVEDDGTGVAGAATGSGPRGQHGGRGGFGGHGLGIMRERATRLRGSLHVGAGARGGTIVRVTIGPDPPIPGGGRDGHEGRAGR